MENLKTHTEIILGEKDAEIERLTNELNKYKNLYDGFYNVVNLVVDDVILRLQDLKKN